MPELPLFPLQTVLFPEGLLTLKVFEARYLDLVGRCLREGRPFGVVALTRGSEVLQRGQAVGFESTGTLAELLDVDSVQTGILSLRCRGGQRFEATAPHQQADGLWLAQPTLLDPDEAVAPAPARADTVRGLEQAIDSLLSQGAQPFLRPYRFDDAGWVANRWCELLPVPLAARQRLMALPDPQLRLQLVDEFLRTKGVVP